MGHVVSWGVRMANRALRPMGAQLRRLPKKPVPISAELPGVDPWVAEIIERVRPFTMTSLARISALCHAVQYVSRAKIPGDIVECGVWRGGSMMAVALALMREGDLRDLYLYDTFEGMPPPTEVDFATRLGRPASRLLELADKSSFVWAIASLDEVRSNLESTSYPQDLIHYVAGKVEDTIPKGAPGTISILRLDTDWYESTKHELVHLYPRLSAGGILIIDDYGFFEGSKKATDEYLREVPPILLQRIDDDARLAVKVRPSP